MTRQALGLEYWLKSEREKEGKYEEGGLVKPWMSGAIEVGYVTAPRRLSVVVGDPQAAYIWIKIVEPRARLRIGHPVVIYDYRFGEYIGGIISAMGYDIDDPTLYERSPEPDLPLTSELVKYNDLSFLELSPLYGVNPVCTLKKEGRGILKESVNFAPHIRAPAYLPPNDIIHTILGTPTEGIPYGIMMIGSDLLRDPASGRYVVYYLKEPILFEHELIIGSTGKGKTVKCKNDIYFFIKRVGGSVIIFDLHDEYLEVSEEPDFDIPKEIAEFEQEVWRSINAAPEALEDVVVWQWARSADDPNLGEGAKPFTIKFSDIPPRSLQYYLPALSPQGYVVLPRLVRMFRSEGLGNSFKEFYYWLMSYRLDEYVIAEKTREAILRRLAPLLEDEVFDGEGLRDVDVGELLMPKRVSVFRLSPIHNPSVRRIIVLHILRKIAEVKLRDSDGKYPPVMILIDEAHNFFPRDVRDEDLKYYIKRAVRLVDRICKEGRKFRLRIEFSTQSPEDLHPDVIKTVNTITFFGVNPVQANLLERTMELPVAKGEIMNLPTRRAVVYSKNNADAPVKVLIPWPLLKHRITKLPS